MGESVGLVAETPAVPAYGSAEEASSSGDWSAGGQRFEARFRAVRARSLALCANLSAEDMMVQSCAEASPAKWHLAHTTWFFESFVLSPFLPGYAAFHPDFHWLFNSYYQSFAAIPEKRLRASFSRPGLEAILAYRQHVDGALARMLEMNPGPETEALRRLELGLHHEEQHQELLLTDIKHALWTNPLRPAFAEGAYRTDALQDTGKAPAPMEFVGLTGGLAEIGFTGAESGSESGYVDGGFSFDNERPRHRVWLEPCRLANRLVTCAEYAEFLADGGYARPELWLSAGWDAVQREGWRAPLYWLERDGAWWVYTLRGLARLTELANTAVCHVSYFEAEAYARWAGCRLPTEAEWEVAAAGLLEEGNLLGQGKNLGRLHPDRVGHGGEAQLAQMFGDCWEWTGSAYLGYPGFQAENGALGEYNGKFMSGQMVLRGGSCVTPREHIRPSYRNFFPPETRWQFSGIRLAR